MAGVAGSEARIFYPALRPAKLRRIRIRVRDLRHTAASLMMATGTDLAAVSGQQGHGNVGITLSTFTHFLGKRGDSGLGAEREAQVQREFGSHMVAIEALRRKGPLASH